MRLLILGADGILGYKAFQVLSGRLDTFATILNYQWSSHLASIGLDSDRLMCGVNILKLESMAQVI